VTTRNEKGKLTRSKELQYWDLLQRSSLVVMVASLSASLFVVGVVRESERRKTTRRRGGAKFVFVAKSEIEL